MENAPVEKKEGPPKQEIAELVLEEKVVEALRSVFDPEIPVNIYEIGLIYGIEVSPDKDVAINMTLTSPMCPVAETLPIEVEMKVKAVPGVKSAKVTIVWEPTWTPDKMSEAAKLQLGMT
ncbi:MAG: SUF system Fe-S cluster assembly protein [Planctomycetota bacterium]|nr:SUF system Fe-S cluster assembly protein [Planctomycetota bacterium]MCZ6691888.1 SUF system Fe-S cluster assembly protein [Planctomycetota bacterium]